VVGKLTAGDDTLRPRVRIVADEHLTGPAREMVQTRLDLWLKTQIEKLLSPLFSLAAADDVTGMARGVAFQVVEALGVLERQRVAEEVKGLDQPARASLRKYGVRFGAYHIYLPVLLKPAPRALATQLWALKHESPDAEGVGELLHLIASGRTSIPVDKETPKTLYRTAGYRVCGERAVRVDILERLADLIRPALSWRESATGPKPDGAFDGRSFTVTGAMTSLTGASGEDFSSILRSLGYRMDRRPKPAEPAEVKPPEPAATAAAETPTPAVDAPSDAPAEAPPEAPAQAADSSLSLLPDAEFLAQAGEPLAAEPAPAETEAAQAQAPAEAAAEPQPDQAAAADAAQLDAAQAAPLTEAAAAEEATFLEVWRPAGRSERRPHRPRRPPRPQQAVQAAPSAAGREAAAAAPATEAAAPAESSEPSGKPRRRGRPDGADRQARRARHDRQQRADRQQQRGERQGDSQDRGRRRDRPRRKRDDGPDRAEREQYYAKPYGAGGERRDKEPDPNSPFAKLAALKQQLEQNGKESS
jgi:ATP-dependent RNA helicase SUPV3L1/SUV3